MEREIELINEIIANAIIHGGDWGGTYESNMENLVIAVNNWLREKGLKDKYHVVCGTYVQTIYMGFKYLKLHPKEYESTGTFPVVKIVPVSEKHINDYYGDLDLIP